MRTPFWNVRDLGTAHRRRMVSKHILEDNLDVVALRETIKQEFSEGDLRDLEGTKEFQ